MGDEEAELLAISLKHNTKLGTLYLQGNDITERGCKSFLKLLVDVSSVESTYNSNHTLAKLSKLTADATMNRLIDSAVELNGRFARAAGRAKVINYQLNSQNRRELCQLQGIEYLSIGTLLSDLEPTLLPRILSLIGREHGKSEMYTALILMVPVLMSCVDTSRMIEDEMTRNSAQADTLRQQANALMQQASEFTAKNDQLRRRLAKRESGDRRQANGIIIGGRKRQKK